MKKNFFRTLIIFLIIVTIPFPSYADYGPIQIDNYYDDWEDKPHTEVYPGNEPPKKFNLVSLFRDESNIYVHVIFAETNNQGIKNMRIDLNTNLGENSYSLEADSFMPEEDTEASESLLEENLDSEPGGEEELNTTPDGTNDPDPSGENGDPDPASNEDSNPDSPDQESNTDQESNPESGEQNTSTDQDTGTESGDQNTSTDQDTGTESGDQGIFAGRMQKDVFIVADNETGTENPPAQEPVEQSADNSPGDATAPDDLNTSPDSANENMDQIPSDAAGDSGVDEKQDKADKKSDEGSDNNAAQESDEKADKKTDEEELNGNMNQNKPGEYGTWAFSVLDGSVPVGSGYYTKSEGEPDELELYLPLSTITDEFDGITEISMVIKKLGKQEIFCVGASTAPLIGIAVGAGIAIMSAGAYTYRKKRPFPFIKGR